MPEARKQRVDRELIELLGELRVVLPGVQVLFAFLLILPFQAGFAAVTDLERGVYFGALVGVTAAIVLLIAPSSYHRLRFRTGVDSKERMLLASNRLVIAGTALLALSMVAVVFLIAELLFGHAWAVAVAAAAAAAFGWFWFLMPLRTPRADDAPDRDGE